MTRPVMVLQFTHCFFDSKSKSLEIMFLVFFCLSESFVKMVAHMQKGANTNYVDKYGEGGLQNVYAAT